MALLTDPSGNDAERVRDLRRMKAVPLALLLVAAALYLVARFALEQPDAWSGWDLVRAGAEAGVVGGLADWFAVTALFRRPLGLPIPHTALIPRKKDQLGRSLSAFVQENFLAADNVAAKLAAAEPGRRLGEYLCRPGHRERIVSEASGLAVAGLAGVDDRSVQLLVRNTVFTHAAATAWSPAAGRLLSAAVADRSHQGVVDVALVSLHRWLRENRADLIDLVADAGPVSQTGPIRWFHEQVGARLVDSLLAWVAEVRDEHDHDARDTLDNALKRLADDMRTDPRMIERIERWKLDLLEHPQTQRAVTELWPTVRRLLTEALEDPDSDLRQRLGQAIAGFGERLVADPEFRQEVDSRIEAGARFLVDRYGSEAVSVISETVDRWDGGEAARRIELAVGRDLQFIRINGTVVGALAGLTIHGVSQVLLAAA